MSGADKFIVEVTQTIEVSLDESKFTPEFLAEFIEMMYDFQTLEQHAGHIAQLHARGLFDGNADEFIEGYGPADEMGIEARLISQDEWVKS